MADPRTTRRNVADDYARAVTSGQGCCSGPAPKGIAAGIAGYTADDFAVLPDDAVANAFGCGNPLAFSAVRPGQVVLDLGSGAGIDLLLAARKVGPAGRVIGVDMTDEMIARARENAAAAGLANVEVRKGIIEELPVDDASVDWVISNCVINLSPEKDRVFAEIARVLRPGGTMLVSDIVAEGVSAEIAANRHLYSSCLAGAISEEDYLSDIEIVDRVVYDTPQLSAFIGSEMRGDDGACLVPGAADADTARRYAQELAGRVASVKVRARKAVR